MPNRHPHIILVTGLARAGKTTLLARIYAEATRVTGQQRDYRISFPYLTLSGQEEEALAYIQERWEWIENHFDERSKTKKEEPIYMDATYHSHTTRFVIYDAPGEAFASRLAPGESEIEPQELERIKGVLKERLSSRRLDAAIVVVNAEQLLSPEGHKSSNLVNDFLTAAKIGEFGSKSFPVMVVVTHCRCAGVNHEKLRQYLFGDASQPEQKLTQKPGPMDFYKDLAIFCVDNLSDLKKNRQSKKYELPSSSGAGQTATRLTAVTPQEAWLSDTGAVFSELMRHLERRCFRRHVMTAVSAAAAATLLIVGLFLADVASYKWATYEPNAVRMERYLGRSKLWPFKRYTSTVGAAWARLHSEELRSIVREEGDNFLGRADEYMRKAEASPYHRYLAASNLWQDLRSQTTQTLDDLTRLAQEKQNAWPAMAHENWAGFMEDYNSTLSRLRACASLEAHANLLMKDLNSQRETEKNGLQSAAKFVAEADSPAALSEIASTLEKQTCEFADDRAEFDVIIEKTAERVWMLHDMDKRLEILKELSDLPKLAPERKQQLTEKRLEAAQERADLEKLHTAACEVWNQFERDRTALVKALNAVEAFLAKVDGQVVGTVGAWRVDLESKRNRLREEKTHDDIIATEAATLLAAIKDEASEAGLNSFRSAGRRVRDALATYRVAEAMELRSAWASKLKSCIENTLVPSNSRDGFKTALVLVTYLEEFDPAQKDYVAQVTANLKKSWADYEWTHLSLESQHAVLNADFPRALEAIKKYRDDGETFEKRVSDSERLWDEVVTEWNDTYFARFKRMNSVVHDQNEFDNKMSQLEDKQIPPLEFRAASLRELLGKQREALTVSYNQMMYAAISDRIRNLDHGILQRWDELDGIAEACKRYMDDRRIPNGAKGSMDEVKRLHNRLAALRAPTSVRIETVAVWGTMKTLNSLHWFNGAYFAPVVQFNQDTLFTVADTRKGTETELENLQGWKDAYAMDHVEEAGRDINLRVWEDRFAVNRQLQISEGDKVTIRLYSSKDPKKLDENVLLLNREIDLGKFTPGFLAAHPCLRFEGAMQGKEPELRRRDATAGVILTVTVEDEDRWKF